ncbi:nucleotidyltransferase domain-containing protein [Pseudobacillus badius]|uniref:nucleotidyltransferase domain-containing protein n=1 Tax=Bacillus badius TaxID=1455 RepID=UPI003D34DB21
MQTTTKNNILLEVIEQLDLPESIDRKVRDRYISLSKWFGRENSSLRDINIDIFSQGSFALGTTIKPLKEDEEYDLDMGCKLDIEGYKDSHTQEELKQLIGQELELYRNRVGIEKPLDEKRRCWRLEYKDEVGFHLDIVPCIPLENERKVIYESRLLEAYGYEQTFNQDVAHFAVNITDTENENYSTVTDEWNISNPQGYVRWFQQQMQKSKQGIFESKASIEPVPKYEQKTVLQRCIQLLKRHRDNMFEDNKDSKPISIIITTLAGRAYNGEQSLEEAIINILNKMPQYIHSQRPRVPNPVKPEEDFTDRWDNPEFSHLNLEANFRVWLNQAYLDFKKLLEKEKIEEIRSILNESFSLNVSSERLEKEFGYKVASMPTVQVINTPSIKPWCP